LRYITASNNNIPGKALETESYKASLVTKNPSLRLTNRYISWGHAMARLYVL